MDANMGGTMLKEPLEYIMHNTQNTSRRGRTFSRQVFVLTDGQTRDEQRILDMVSESNFRIFSLGVGSGVSTSLVEGLAAATQGHAAFVQDGDQLEPICISLLK